MFINRGCSFTTSSYVHRRRSQAQWQPPLSPFSSLPLLLRKASSLVHQISNSTNPSPFTTHCQVSSLFNKLKQVCCQLSSRALSSLHSSFLKSSPSPCATRFVAIMFFLRTTPRNSRRVASLLLFSLRPYFHASPSTTPCLWSSPSLFLLSSPQPSHSLSCFPLVSHHIGKAFPFLSLPTHMCFSCSTSKYTSSFFLSSFPIKLSVGAAFLNLHLSFHICICSFDSGLPSRDIIILRKSVPGHLLISQAIQQQLRHQTRTTSQQSLSTKAMCRTTILCEAQSY